jgi:flagellar biosynthesis protein
MSSPGRGGADWPGGAAAGIPRRRAVALRYDPAQENAPVLIAKGKGYLADKIIELAREHGIHVQSDPALVELLMEVDLSEQVPPQLYKVVAKVLTTVYRVNQDLAKKRGLR